MSGLKLQKGCRRLSAKGRKKEKLNGLYKGVSGGMRYRTPMGGLKPDAYIMPEMVMELVENIDGIVDKFFEDAVIDGLNSGAFLDEYIDHIIELARIQLKQQALEHRQMIEGIRSVERGELLTYMSRHREIKKGIEGEWDTAKEGEYNEETPKLISKEIIA